MQHNLSKLGDYEDVYGCDLCGRPTFRDAQKFYAQNNAHIGGLMVICNKCKEYGRKLEIVEPGESLPIKHECKMIDTVESLQKQNEELIERLTNYHNSLEAAYQQRSPSARII